MIAISGFRLCILVTLSLSLIEIGHTQSTIWDNTESLVAVSSDYFQLNASVLYATSFSFIENDLACGAGAYEIKNLSLGLSYAAGPALVSIFVALFRNSVNGPPTTSLAFQSVLLNVDSSAGFVSVTLPVTFAMDISANPSQSFAIVIQSAV